MATNLVIQTAFLGDLLLSIPLLKRIRTLSDEKLILMCRAGLGDFFLKTGLVDDIIEIKKGHRQSYNLARLRLENEELRSVIIPHQSVRTHLFVWSLKAQSKIGFSKWWNQIFLDRRIHRDLSVPDALRQLSLVSESDPALVPLLKKYKHERMAYRISSEGKLSDPPLWAKMSLREKILEDRSHWSRWLEKSPLNTLRDKSWILIFPGSVWATKRWKTDGFKEVATSLQRLGYQVLWMGAPEEKSLCDGLAHQVPGSISLAGQTTIYESAMVMARSKLVIGNDSASMHISSCTETPSLAIFGPTVIEFGYRPWGTSSYLLQFPNLSCRPCGPHGNQRCPLGTHHCMAKIPAASVTKMAEKILGLHAGST